MKGSKDFAFGSKVWPGVAKLVEELGENGQVLGKLMMTGGEHEHWDGSNLSNRLELELGDLLAAIEFVMKHNASLDRVIIVARKAEKLALFEKWHKEQALP